MPGGRINWDPGLSIAAPVCGTRQAILQQLADDVELTRIRD
jgi:hypothetical protein